MMEARSASRVLWVTRPLATYEATARLCSSCSKSGRNMQPGMSDSFRGTQPLGLDTSTGTRHMYKHAGTDKHGFLTLGLRSSSLQAARCCSNVAFASATLPSVKRARALSSTSRSRTLSMAEAEQSSNSTSNSTSTGTQSTQELLCLAKQNKRTLVLTRHRDTETHTDTQTHRHTQTHTDTQRHRDTETLTHTHTHTDTQPSVHTLSHRSPVL